MSGEIPAFGCWKDNAELMVACRDLGYLDDKHGVWDATYGLGAFWKQWEPRHLHATDLDRFKGRDGVCDFTNSLFTDRQWHHVVFDPPYKLNGTATEAVDARYGVADAARWQDRMELIRRGVAECARVLGDGFLLVKCMDQVVSGRKRWQTFEITRWAADRGLGLVDRLDMPTGRPQPAGRRQVHARSNTSTLLVFKRGWWTSHEGRAS